MASEGSLLTRMTLLTFPLVISLASSPNTCPWNQNLATEQAMHGHSTQHLFDYINFDYVLKFGFNSMSQYFEMVLSYYPKNFFQLPVINFLDI